MYILREKGNEEAYLIINVDVQRPNLSHGLNPPKPGLNLETFDTILSGTNLHIQSTYLTTL